HISHVLSFSLLPPPPRSTLFPYTTLFRSHDTSMRQVVTAVNGALSQVRREMWWVRGCSDLHVELHVQVVHSSWLFLRRIYATLRSEEHTSELQSRENLVCRLLLEKKNKHR